MTIKELGIAAAPVPEKDVVFNGQHLAIKQKLTTNEKSVFLQFVVDASVDTETGVCTAWQTAMAFEIAVCRFYAGIDFLDSDFADIGYLMDSLNDSGLYAAIVDAIPEDEFNDMVDLVKIAVKEQSDYNTSAAGIIHAMSQEETGLGDQVRSILADVEAAKGLENLAAIKDMVGTD